MIIFVLHSSFFNSADVLAALLCSNEFGGQMVLIVTENKEEIDYCVDSRLIPPESYIEYTTHPYIQIIKTSGGIILIEDVEKMQQVSLLQQSGLLNKDLSDDKKENKTENNAIIIIPINPLVDPNYFKGLEMSTHTLLKLDLPQPSLEHNLEFYPIDDTQLFKYPPRIDLSLQNNDCDVSKGGWIQPNILIHLSKYSPTLHRLISLILLRPTKHLIILQSSGKSWIPLISTILGYLECKYTAIRSTDSSEEREKAREEAKESRVILTECSPSRQIDIENIHFLHLPSFEQYKTWLTKIYRKRQLTACKNISNINNYRNNMTNTCKIRLHFYVSGKHDGSNMKSFTNLMDEIGRRNDGFSSLLHSAKNMNMNINGICF